MSLIQSADLLCERHRREAADRGVSVIELMLAVGHVFIRADRFRSDNVADEAFYHRPVCEHLTREEFEWCWRKAIRSYSPIEKEKKRVPVPTTPISEA